MTTPHQQDPVRLVAGVGAIVVLLAMIVVSVLSLGGQSNINALSLIAASQEWAEERELERCQAIALTQLASDDSGHRVWGDQRRRFFKLAPEEDKASPTNVPTAPSAPPETTSTNTNRATGRHPTISAPRKE